MKKIVVLGAGYAGLKTVVLLQKKLKGEGRIVLVDRNTYHYEATDLHEVAAGNLPPAKISYQVSDLINSKVTTFIQDEVVKVNPDDKTVELAHREQPLDYDYCVVSLGFTSETFGIEGAKENALQMTNVKEALEIHSHIIDKMKDYKITKNPDDLKIIVCGAGFTGIELAGALVDARPRYAQIAGVKPEDIQISLIEASERLLPMFNQDLANYGVNLVKKLGVHLYTSCLISRIKPSTVIYQHGRGNGDESMTAGTIIWTTGVSGSPVMAESGFNERRGRVVVTDHLNDPDHDDLYIIGDVAAVMAPGSPRPYPTTAQLALSMADYVADDIADRVKKGERLSEPYAYKSLGTVASVGNTRAFGVAMGHEVKGYVGSFMKKMIANRSLLEVGGLKELFAKGRFDLYH